MRTKLLAIALMFSMQINSQCWSKIASGQFHTLAIAEDGTLWTWGATSFTNLIGTTVWSNVPVQIGTDSDWVSIGAGSHHNFAIKTNGTLWGWGYNYYGELGTGTFGNTANIALPTQIGSDTNWRSVTGGSFHSLAIKYDGTLWATGKNTNGQLGLNDLTDRHVFTQVNSDTDWDKITCGSNHSLALKTAGQLYVWGANGAGQLGLYASTTDLKIPGWILQTATFTAIAGGLNSTIAIKSDGTMWRAGTGCPILGSSYPMAEFITSPANWNSVKIGNNFVIAIKNDGTIWGLGSSNYGQLGQVSDSPTVFAFVGSNAAITNGTTNIAVNNYSTLVMKANTQIYATGQNDGGQLGLGDIVDKTTFTAIPCPLLDRDDFSQNNIEINIYPNPIHDRLNFAIVNNLEVQKVTVFDFTGKLVKQQLGNVTSMAVDDLTTGVYLLEITIDDKTEIKKFVKQ